MVAWGRTNLEIAADLKITERTVKAHLTSVYDKTKSGNRLSLALLINRG
jgi:DNA-binding CsgD family transcriptional regulator